MGKLTMYRYHLREGERGGGKTLDVKQPNSIYNIPFRLVFNYYSVQSDSIVLYIKYTSIIYIVHPYFN